LRDRKTELILALDLDSPEEAREFLTKNCSNLKYIKIGPKLFIKGGKDFLSFVIGEGWDVFLDVKLHDIPNTVKGAVEAASELGLWALTLHAAGGIKMMEDAFRARGSKEKPLLFGVTVLTSMDESTLQEVTPGCSIKESLVARAKACLAAKMDGIVCSTKDLHLFSGKEYENLLKVVPGIRPKDFVNKDDQKRVATPAEAARSGADYIVVGRPILLSHDPKEVINNILEDLENE
jgi:orotidine-5'-phosphate decarboxylase